MAAKAGKRACPYCKEDIKADALKCKHCRSRLAPESPSHEGICPYCKESIHPQALKCKHCHSIVISLTTSGEGCADVMMSAAPVGLRQRRMGSFPIPPGDLKCALEYLDCLDRYGDDPYGRATCDLLHTICRLPSPDILGP